MDKKIAFIGHSRLVWDGVENRLTELLTQKIKEGYSFFSMGTHGNFDAMALRVCRKLRAIYPHINIEVVITSLNSIKKRVHTDMFGTEVYTPYEDVNTIMYEIEEVHFKRKIIVSNQKMVDNCDTLICYVDPDVAYSGARRVLNYAKKVNKNIINLFLKTDNPFYNKTKEELEKEFLEYCESVKRLTKSC